MANVSDQPNPTGTPQDVLDWGIQGAADPHRARLQALSIAAGMLTASRADALLVSLTVDGLRPRVTVQDDRGLADWCIRNGGAVDVYAQHGLGVMTTLDFGALEVNVVCWRTADELLTYARWLAGRVLPEDGGPALCVALEHASVTNGGRANQTVVVPLDVARAACEREASLEDNVFVYVDVNTARVDLEALRRRVRA